MDHYFGSGNGAQEGDYWYEYDDYAEFPKVHWIGEAVPDGSLAYSVYDTNDGKLHAVGGEAEHHIVCEVWSESDGLGAFLIIYFCHFKNLILYICICSFSTALQLMYSSGRPNINK